MYILFSFLQSRGSTKDGTGVHDSIVNQLLTKVGLGAFNLFESIQLFALRWVGKWHYLTDNQFYN